jgi:hypothetical protein
MGKKNKLEDQIYELKFTSKEVGVWLLLLEASLFRSFCLGRSLVD